VINRPLHGLSGSADDGLRCGIERHGDSAERDLSEHAEREPSGGNGDLGFLHAGVPFGSMPPNPASKAPSA
jgi:hypothetical protein